MLTVTDVSLQFSTGTLYKHVDLKFAPGNCYGIIGANGAGKSTFLRILSGELEPTTGSVSLGPDDRMSVLEQDHFRYEGDAVMDVVLRGSPRLYAIMKEKDELYAKPDFSETDGERAAELEGEFAELGGWEAESQADQLLNGLGIPMEQHTALMNTLSERQKVKVLLAKALFGSPSIILLDEPTNGLDIESIEWLEEFLINYDGTILVVSHDRHFLNAVCTHIVDIDYSKVQMYAGNYDFWYESSQLIQQLIRNQVIHGRRNKIISGAIAVFFNRTVHSFYHFSVQIQADSLLFLRIHICSFPGAAPKYSTVFYCLKCLCFGLFLISAALFLTSKSKTGVPATPNFSERKNYRKTP